MRLGRPLAPGVAVARAYCLDQGPMPGPARPLDPSETPDEIRRFEAASAAAAQELDARFTHIEWSGNEKVAAEVAIGASIAGRRALAATKSVGLNVMLDPLMALNLTPVHGVLVILLGDDPGGYGSQERPG